MVKKTKKKSKSQEQIPNRKVSLELFHQRLGHKYTKSPLAGYTLNVWQYIELRVDPEPLFTSFQIYSNNKKARPKTHLKTKTPFKWVLMNIIPSTASKRLTKDTTFSNYLLIVDNYSKIPNLYGMENITTEEAMDKLDMFQERFGKVDEFGWWDMDRVQTDSGAHFTSKDF